MPNVDPENIRRVESLTRRYSRFERNAAGLGNVLGGGLAVIAYLTGALVQLTPVLRIALVSTPFVWIVCKEWWRRSYYQRHGRVTEPVHPTERRWHLFRTGFIAFTSAGVLIVFLGLLLRQHRDWPDVATIGYLLLVAAMPVLVWFFMWTVEEFIVGVFLICQAAVVAGGGHYGLETVWALAFGVAAIIVGVKQHREYRALLRQLENVKADS